MLLIDSLYINNSGGLGLLNYLIDEIEKADIAAVYLIDIRNPSEYKGIISNRKILLQPSMSNRRKFYKTLDSKFTKVLCFGNIPPPINLDSKIWSFTYVHQYFYLDSSALNSGLIEGLKFKLKQKIFKHFVTI